MIKSASQFQNSGTATRTDSSLRTFLILLCLWLGGASASASAQTADLGTLTRFYRATQVQGHLMGQGLEDIPDYLSGQDIDLTYLRNPELSEEIPFADEFTIIRFLGGYRSDWLRQYGLWDDSLGNQSLDYVVNAGTGGLNYRSDLIKMHLQPYLAAGYQLGDMTLSMGNIPYAIASDGGSEGIWGQTNPPESWTEWTLTLQHLAGAIKQLYGPSAAPHFKMGGEYDRPESFAGSADDYYKYYSAGYDVLREAFPDSEFAPGEFTGVGTCSNPPICVYDTANLLYFAQTNDILPDYVPRSLHSMQYVGDAMPSAAISRANASYQRLLPRTVSEIHQFGLLGQPFGSTFGSEQGPRAAAWEFGVLMGLREKLRPRRVFHWGTFAKLNGSNISLLNGTGFLRLILDHYVGSRMTRLPVKTLEGTNFEATAVAFQSPESTALIVGSFSPGSKPSRIRIRIDLSSTGLASSPGRLRIIRYAEDKNVFALLKSDLAAVGNLRPEFEQCKYCTAHPNQMAKDIVKLRDTLNIKKIRYENAIRKSLRFRNARTDQGIYISIKKKYLVLTMQGNELLVIE